MAILPIDSGRYGTPEMLRAFGAGRKVELQLLVEAEVARAQGALGVIPERAARQIAAAARSGRVTPASVARIERRTDHDTAALVEALGAQCPPGARPWVHFGLTSNDLVDTSTSMQMRDALDIIAPKTARLALALAGSAEKYARLPAVGRTHGQHASVISFGLKFANWAAEMAHHLERIGQARERVLVCKTLGVMGARSLMGARALDVQSAVARKLGLRPARAATQVVARERHAEYVFALALLGSTLDKMATEVRNLQRTEIGEVAEAFRKGQMGSSAVPVKRNPTKSERVSSLARLLRSCVQVSLENVPLWHERDLTNSANERFTLPTASILADDMVGSMASVVSNLSVDEARVRANLDATGGQIFAEFVLEAMVRKGVARSSAYRDVQRVAFEARASGARFLDALLQDGAVSGVLGPAELRRVFDPGRHLGASARIISAAARSARRAAART